ncbi:MAG TPA: PIN domain-containing protein [Allosphingosinicella sp.]|nr:PIN domain-containing protein [Allosphingosinicella sp.]
MIDTAVAIHLRDQSSEVMRRVSTLDEPPSISIISQVELENGVYAKPDLADLRRLAVDVLLARIEVLPFDAQAVAVYRRIVAARGYSRRRVADRMIAATAIVHDLTLITMNGRDFSDIPGLALTIWPNPVS